MVSKIIQENNVIKVGKEPMVLLPLKEWEKIEEALDEKEETERFLSAYRNTRKEKDIDLPTVKKKYQLR